MIYVDSSVVLAQLVAEDRTPPESLWQSAALVSSRLLEYEVWNRVNARGLYASHEEEVRSLLGRLNFLELAPPVLARTLEPFPVPVRTLDALHLASLGFLHQMGQRPVLATYDRGLADAATALAIPLADVWFRARLIGEEGDAIEPGLNVALPLEFGNREVGRGERSRGPARCRLSQRRLSTGRSWPAPSAARSSRSRASTEVSSNLRVPHALRPRALAPGGLVGVDDGVRARR